METLVMEKGERDGITVEADRAVLEVAMKVNAVTALLDDNTRRIRSLEVADAYKEKTALNFGGEKSKGRALLIGKAKLE